LDMVGRNVDIVKVNYESLESNAAVYGLEVSEKSVHGSFNITATGSSIASGRQEL
jgi:hypothetical protein